MDFLNAISNDSGGFANLLVYCAVFIAVCLPIAFWKRETFTVSEMPIGDWNRLPSLFKAFWKVMTLFETTLGAFLCAIFGRSARKYFEFAEIAALPVSPRQVFVCKAALAPLFAAVACLAYLPDAIPSAVANVAVAVFALLGWFLPSMQLAASAQLRQEEIVKSLPFAIDLMGSAMRAGLDFGSAMRYYTGLGGGGALEQEFARVLRDASLGKPIAESMSDMAARVRIKTFTAFAGVIAYGMEIGASISDTLKVHGAEMRRERFAIAEQKAARAPSVMIFPIAMFILPAVFLIIFVPVLLQFKATQGQ